MSEQPESQVEEPRRRRAPGGCEDELPEDPGQSTADQSNPDQPATNPMDRYRWT